jgi:hypothetical protein
MKLGWLINISLCLLTLTSAQARVCLPPEPQPPPPVPEVTISPQACRYLMQQNAALSAVYQPGLDSAGRAVAPADLPAVSQLELPRSITIEIAPALAHWLPNQSTPYDTLNLSRINLGTISMTGGLLTFNGQPLGRSHDDELLALCQTRR